jgi:hypothetical protein
VTILQVQRIDVPDPDVWPTDYSKTVVRYSLVDERGVVYLGGRGFGVLEGMVQADRTSSDCRYLLRKTELEALNDLVIPMLKLDGDIYDECHSHFSAYGWPWVEALICQAGVDPVIDAFFECSGDTAVRESHFDLWIDTAIEKFGESLRPHAERRYANPAPKYMPTSYLYDDAISRRRKAELIANIKETARRILARLDGAL